jgi:predicted kinase
LTRRSDPRFGNSNQTPFVDSPTVDRALIVISGAPGSGKSTLAGQLSRITGIAVLSKDVIKEALWDALEPPVADLYWSRRVGGAAMEVLWALAAQCPRVILEANFRPHSHHERAKLSGLSGALVEVHCQCPPALAARRYERRAAQPAHHPAHVSAQLDPELLAEFDGPIGLGTLIEVDTARNVDVEAIARRVVSVLDTVPGTGER